MIAPVAAATPPAHHGTIEWTWIVEPASIDDRLPDVLLIGDSITRNYYPDVATALTGRANVFLFSTSASAGDARLPAQIAEYGRMIDRRFAVVHFNNGMHGWAYTDRDYAVALPSVVAAIRAACPGARLVWASTTPVRRDAAAGATNARIDARNAAAARTMTAAAIGTDDQHALMTGKTLLYADDVHFGAAGSAIQGASAALSIADRLRCAPRVRRGA